MKSPYQFIVKPLDGKRYKNTKKYGEVELIINTSQEDHMAVNRYAVVVSTPITYQGEIVPGDTLLCHHNAFRIMYDMKGQAVSSKSHFRGDLFLLDTEQFFLYKHDDTWKTHDRYCFVKPVPAKDSILQKIDGEEPLIGILRYGNPQLDALGVHEGDEICYQPESEYEFDVDGEKLYRMFVSNITMVL